MIDQLNLLVCAIMSNTVIDNHVKAVPSAPHVDGEGDRVADMDRAGDPRAGQAVARPDFHEALGGS